jgi:hypothetical protein
MASFKDALTRYKKPEPAAEAPVPVNPPEAVKVLEEQTVPETEGKAEPAPLEVAKPKATRAPRGSSKKSAEPQESTATEASSPAAPAEPRDDEMGYAIGIIKRGLPAGVSITIVGG